MPHATRKRGVLFLCTGASCRSQMAAGWTRALQGDRFEAYAAGTAPKGLNPLAVRAMREAGVDISGHASCTPAELGESVLASLEAVVTVCDAAHESCPVLPGAARVIHRAFDDPPRLAEGAANEEEAMAHYRRVRDEIRAFVETLPGALAPVSTQPAKGGAR